MTRRFQIAPRIAQATVEIDLIAHGHRAIMPTASIAGTVVLLVPVDGFVIAASRWPIAYVLLTIAMGLPAEWAVVSAFTADPVLRPFNSGATRVQS